MKLGRVMEHPFVHLNFSVLGLGNMGCKLDVLFHSVVRQLRSFRE